MGAGLGNLQPSNGFGPVPQLELIMISLKVLSTAAAMALLMTLAVPTEGFAQNPHGSKANGGVRPGGGGIRHGAAVHANGGAHGYRGGAPAARFSGGSDWQDDRNRHPGGVFISGSVVGAVGFYDNGYYER